MQTEEPSFAKTVVNVSYLSRKRSGTCAVKPIPSTKFLPDTSSSLKVKQHLNQLAKEEAKFEKGFYPVQRPLSAEPYLKFLEQNAADSTQMPDGVFSFPKESHSEPNLVKPRVLKPRVISNSDEPLSQILGSELFSAGSIPSNKEIDRVLDMIKAFRQQNCSIADSKSNEKEQLTRRYSDITDLRSSSKRRIQDSPSRVSHPTVGPPVGSLESGNQFKSANSAFKPVNSSKKTHLQNSQGPIPEENAEDILCDPECSVQEKPCTNVRIKTSRPASIVVSVDGDSPDVPKELSTESTASSSKNTSVHLGSPKVIRPGPSHSPRITKEQQIPPPSSSSKRKEPFTGGFSVRNPTATSSFKSSTEASLPKPYNSFKCELEDFVPNHSVTRKNRLKYRRCSQPCIPSSTLSEDEGVEKLPYRYAPNTHPRAKLPSHLAACSGNHPPVSYLNSFGRSRSLQVNHIALHEFRNLQIENVNRIKCSDQPNGDENEEPELVDSDANAEESLTGDSNGDHPLDPTTSETSDRASSENLQKCDSSAIESDESQSVEKHEDSAAPCPDLDNIKNAFKRIGRKYLSDQRVKPNLHPEIESKNSLSFVFSGNQELQDKVRTFLQQTNKSYCKQLIRQRFVSNLSDCPSETSVINCHDRSPEGRDVSDFTEIINAHVAEQASSNVTESLQSVLLKSEGFLSNKCDRLCNGEKLKKSENFFKFDNLTTLDLSSHRNKLPACELIHSTPIQNGTPPLHSTRPKFDSNTSDGSEPVCNRNDSKTSRDSGYGDSTSASNEILGPSEQRVRSSSLTLISKLKPLFRIKKEMNAELDKENPFNRIFDDHPISVLTKSVDKFIARRGSPPNSPSSPSPHSSPYNEDRPVFDSPPELKTGDVSEPTPVSDECIMSPKPPSCEEDGEQEDMVFCHLRKSYEDLGSEPLSALPTSLGHFSLQDIQEILDSFDVLHHQVPPDDTDYHEVQEMLQSKMTIALSSIYDSLINSKIPPNSKQYMSKPVLDEMLDYLDERLELEEDNAEILELVGLLETFEDFIDLHDEIISRRYYENETLPELKSPTITSEKGDEIEPANHSIYRMVGLHKNKGEPLGITLKKEDDKVVVHRILQGGMIDKQRLLHIGDVIISVNGEDVPPKPDMIQIALRDQEGDIHLKIIPSYREQAPMCQVFVKAHFNYDPKSDNLIPCKEAGLKFIEGDILQIVNQDDPNWWQAKLEGGEGQAGLIPGLILQEQRMAGIKDAVPKNSAAGCGATNSSRRRKKKKNKKLNYSANKNADFDSHELVLYEEVAKMPPFNRKTLVMIGAQGVGRRSLISKLVLNEPDKFGNTMPHTSRPIRPGERDGCGYWFTTREKMDEDITNHKYLEYGEYEGHLYGTKLDSIRQVMRSGKMCLLDVNPQSLKILKTSEFVPYIVFVEAPPFEVLVQMHRESAKDNPKKAFSENDLKKSIDESKQIKRQYSHYFDVIIQNGDMDATYTRLYECISKLSTSPQWVPVSWVY